MSCRDWCSPQAAARGLVGPENGDVEHLSLEEQAGLDAEGRCIMTDHGAFVLFNVYIPALSSEEHFEVPSPACFSLPLPVALPEAIV